VILSCIFTDGNHIGGINDHFVVEQQWHPDVNVLNFCLENNVLDIHEPLIETAFDSFNNYLYNWCYIWSEM